MARVRSADMLNRDYFSHYTPDGKSISDYVGPIIRSEYFVGENIAKGGDGTDTDTPLVHVRRPNEEPRP